MVDSKFCESKRITNEVDWAAILVFPSNSDESSRNVRRTHTNEALVCYPDS